MGEVGEACSGQFGSKGGCQCPGIFGDPGLAGLLRSGGKSIPECGIAEGFRFMQQSRVQDQIRQVFQEYDSA